MLYLANHSNDIALVMLAHKNGSQSVTHFVSTTFKRDYISIAYISLNSLLD